MHETNGKTTTKSARGESIEYYLIKFHKLSFHS